MKGGQKKFREKERKKKETRKSEGWKEDSITNKTKSKNIKRTGKNKRNKFLEFALLFTYL